MPLRFALALVALFFILPAHHCAAQDANQPPPASNGVSTWSCVSTRDSSFRIFSKDLGFKCYCEVRTPDKKIDWIVDSGWRSGFGCKGFCRDSAEWAAAKTHFKNQKDSGTYWTASNMTAGIKVGFISADLELTLRNYAMSEWMKQCEHEAWIYMDLAKFIPTSLAKVTSGTYSKEGSQSHVISVHVF